MPRINGRKFPFSASLFAGLFIALLSSTAGAQQRFELDNAHTSLVFAVSHFNLSYTYGRFNSVAGSFDMDGDSPTTFNFVVRADSIDTNSPDRDEHLRGQDFFDTESFPTISFQSTGIERAEETFNITGNIMILGKSKEVVLPARLVGMGVGPFGKIRAGFFATFTIKRSDFGMDAMADAVGDNISITFSFEGFIPTETDRDSREKS